MAAGLPRLRRPTGRPFLLPLGLALVWLLLASIPGASAQGQPVEENLGHLIVKSDGMVDGLASEVTIPCNVESVAETWDVLLLADAYLVRPLPYGGNVAFHVEYDVYQVTEGDEWPLLVSDRFSFDDSWGDLQDLSGVRSLGDAQELDPGGLTRAVQDATRLPVRQIPLTFSFVHETNPYETITYELHLRAIAGWTELPDEAGHRLDKEIQVHVEPCDEVPLEDLVMSVDVPQPDFPEPPIRKVDDATNAVPGLAPQPLEPMASLAPPASDLVGGGVSASFASSWSVHDRYITDGWASPCNPNGAHAGIDANLANQDAYYLVSVNGPTRIDIYYEGPDNRVYHWWYVNLPSAGTWCIVSNHQALHGNWGDAKRGWWTIYAFVNGNGGYKSGSYMGGSSYDYTVEPYVYKQRVTGTYPICPAFWSNPPSKATFFKTDPRATVIADIYSQHVETTHAIRHQFQHPGTGTTYTAFLNVQPGSWGWEHCHWLWIDGTSTEDRPGLWQHESVDQHSGVGYGWTDSFTLQNRLPGSFSLLSPPHGSTQTIPVTLSWNAAPEPDGDPVTYRVQGRINGGAPQQICLDTDQTNCQPTLPTSSSIEWWVEAHDLSPGGGSSTTTHRTFSTSGPDADGDGIEDSVDIDPNHDVKVRVRALELQYPDDTRAHLKISFSNGITGASGPNPSSQQRWGDAVTGAAWLSVTSNIPDNWNTVDITLKLLKDSAAIDINDDTTTSPKECKLRLDTRTGYWTPVAGVTREGQWQSGSAQEHLNNGYGFCAESPSANPIVDEFAHGRQWVLFEVELTDGDGDGMPHDWESTNGLDSSVDDGGADLDNDGFTNYEEWWLRRDPNDANEPGIIYPHPITFWIHKDDTGAPHALSPGSATEQEELRRQLAWTSQYIWDLTDGHVLIRDWEEVDDETDADVRLRYPDNCPAGNDNGAFATGAYRFRATNPGVPPNAGYVQMPLIEGTHGCDYLNGVRSDPPMVSTAWSYYGSSRWARVLSHELMHLVFQIPDEYFGPVDVGEGVYNNTDTHAFNDFTARCYTWRSESATPLGDPAGTNTGIMTSVQEQFSELSGPGDDAVLRGGHPTGCGDTWPWSRLNYAYGDGTCPDNPPAGANWGDPCADPDQTAAGAQPSAWHRLSHQMSLMATNAGVTMNWDFDHDGTLDALATLAARFEHRHGPNDPVYPFVEVTFS